jgi:hypothetical protein
MSKESPKDSTGVEKKRNSGCFRWCWQQCLQTSYPEPYPCTPIFYLLVRISQSEYFQNMDYF